MPTPNKKQKYIITILLEFEDVFDVTMGTWNMPPEYF